MNSLQLSDYKGIIQYLGFERKMMSDIDFVCRDGHHKSKKTYVKKRVKFLFFLQFFFENYFKIS